jgi:hypothetical protein
MNHETNDVFPPLHPIWVGLDPSRCRTCTSHVHPLTHFQPGHDNGWWNQIHWKRGDICVVV